jgi:hypothetical protein
MAKRTSSRRTHRYYTNPKASKSSGMSDGAKIAFALAGVAVIGGIGYYLWNQSQAATTAAAGGGTISSGNQPYQLGTSTSTGMPAATATGTSDGLPISFEAGAGANAPLVPTAGA